MTRSGRLEALAVIGLAVLGLGLGSDASVEGSRAADVREPGGLAISSIDLSSGPRDAIFSAQGMLPGDAVGAAITVSNPGRQPMTYAMRHGPVPEGGAALSAALIVTIKTVGSSCTDFDGITLYDGPLEGAAFGSQGIGRLLPGATAEILCFRAVLPREADNSVQGAAATISLTFSNSSEAPAR